ncbi:ParA family protein [Nocardiopsis sp. L17-MgMaSL7]|uniref:ParA family protein n=1 Tax=Nocardiopsis sp. L17-MgMaSL7 TaxID=1938893 RepID=UPI000D7131ED|nr:ParA family protein [Nocardiopsis sp. L17-MgMaSL7]PWV44590.1 chromosome partitioning protein [Nocardiopsis sp. L17-MgMaSL7]
MTNPRIIALANHKGGVGKTTTTINLGATLAAAGRRVLIIDLDPQANATLALNPIVGDYTLAEVLSVDDVTQETVPGSAASAIVPAAAVWPEGLDVLPGSIASASRENEQWEAREYRLRRACEGALDDYDVVLMDLPPSLGQLTINALTMADEVWTITSPAFFSAHGIELLMTTVDRVQRFYNPNLVIGPIIVNDFDIRTTEARFRLNEIQEAYTDRVYEEPCPRATVIAKAAGAQHPLSAYGAEGARSVAWYATLAKTRLGLVA